MTRSRGLMGRGSFHWWVGTASREGTKEYAPRSATEITGVEQGITVRGVSALRANVVSPTL